MMCIPESVNTGSLISPTLRAKVASSKGFCNVQTEPLIAFPMVRYIRDAWSIKVVSGYI